MHMLEEPVSAASCYLISSLTSFLNICFHFNVAYLLWCVCIASIRYSKRLVEDFQKQIKRKKKTSGGGRHGLS